MRAVFGTIMADAEGGWGNPRPLGPAIVRDAWGYARRRLGHADPAPPEGYPDDSRAVALAEALVLFVLPQYGGLDAPAWERLSERLAEALAQSAPPADQWDVAAAMHHRLDVARRGLFGAFK